MVYGLWFLKNKKKLLPPGIEPATCDVIAERNYHYTKYRKMSIVFFLRLNTHAELNH